MPQPRLSFAIPCYNERDNLVPLVSAIETEAQRLEQDYEIVITDDCSTDGSWELLQSLTAKHPRLRAQRLAHNSGESAASFAAMRAARGDIIVTLDADLQNDPRDLSKFLEAIEHADCVCGTRKESRREGDNWIKSSVSRASNWIRSRMLHDPITDAGCTYRAIRRECIADIPFFMGVHRFIPILRDMHGYRIVEVPVVNQERNSGNSHYGVLDRAGAVVDMFAVRWMKKRMRKFSIIEQLPPE
ncbi:MAG: glycosyltransferase family 2 protein [Gammaproteobacteria bacterium]